jgi:hypothetical protein
MTSRPIQLGTKSPLPLHRTVLFILEECRMVLPGIQTLFGFQLIAVFNTGFAQKLTEGEQRLHLLSIGLIVVAIALIMSPAAFHRQAGADEVTETLVRIATRLLLWSMLPLELGISIDFYLVARIVMKSRLVGFLAVAIFGLFFTLWFLLPRVRALQKIVAGVSPRGSN